MRRALGSGLLVWLVSGLILAAVGLAAGGGAAVGVAGGLLGLLAGAITASVWLLVSAIRDLFGDRLVGGRRLVVTALVSVVALTTPIVLAALAMAVAE